MVVKNTPLTVLLFVALLAPTAALAQTDDPPADAPVAAEGSEAEGSEAEGSEAPAAEAPAGEAPADGEAAPDEAADGAAPDEAAEGADTAVAPVEAAQEPEPAVAEPEPMAEPEPEMSAVETASGLGQAEEDIAESDEEMQQEDDAATEEDEASLPWALPITWSNSMSLDTVNGDRLLSENPTYAMAFAIAPRWTFDNGLTLSAAQMFWVELTESGSTTTERQWEFPLDFRLGASMPLPWTPGDFRFTARAALVLPTSKTSRASGGIMSPGGGLAISRSFDVLEGLSLSGGASYRYWIASRNVAEASTFASSPFGDDDGRVCAVADHNDPTSSSCIGGSARSKHFVAASLGVNLMPVAGLSVGTSFAMIWNKAHDLAPADFTASGVPMTLPDESETHLRIATLFSLSIGYRFTRYLNGSLAFVTIAPEFDDDGDRENPLWNEFSTLDLNLTFSLDGLFQNSAGGGGNRTGGAVTENDYDDEGAPVTADGEDGSPQAAAPSARTWW